MKSRHDISVALAGRLLGRCMWGVEIQCSTDGQACYFLAELRQHKGRIQIVRTIETTDAERVLSLVGKHPVSVCLTGKGVISRSCEIAESPDIQKLIPGLDPEKLEVRSYQNDRCQWVSVAKPEHIEQMLQPFGSAKLHVVKLELGGVYLLQHTHLFQHMPQHLGNHLFSWDETALLSYTTGALPSEPTSREEERFYDEPVRFTLAILCALECFGRTLPELFASEESRLKHFALYRVRKAGGVISLAGLLLILLLNFLILQQTRTSIAELQSEVEMLEGQQQAFEQQQQSALSDISLYKDLNGHAAHSYAELLENIAARVPAQVVLRACHVHPPTNQRKRRGEEEAFNKSRVTLSGHTQDLHDLNAFIESLTSLPWVAQAELEELEHDSKARTNLFTIRLEL